jgi:hypothetical protein
MIDFKINKQGVYLSVNGEQVEQEVGTVLKLDSDVVPAFLSGKGEVIGDNEGKSLVTNDELLESAMAENKELSEKLAYATTELQKVPSLLASLESARELAIEHAKKLDAANAEIAELKKPKSGR